MRIGSVEIENPYILAPMAGVTDLPFRLLCREMGAGLVSMEMVSAKAISYGNKNTAALMVSDEAERPVSLQLFGCEPELMAEVAKRIEVLPFDILDINMGCPMPKIVNNGEGSALMKNPQLVGKIIESVSSATVKPVTVKIRKGYDETDINASEIAYIAQESGAAAVQIHGRTRTQLYSGEADWDIIGTVKSRVKIPVIGNGDIQSFEDAKRMMDQTGCDAVSIGRAARGNPWIFKELVQKTKYLPTLSEKKAVMLRHLEMAVLQKGEFTAIREMRKHIGWYTSGMAGSAKLRVKVNLVDTASEMEELILALT